MHIDVIAPEAMSEADLVALYEIERELHEEMSPEDPMRTREGYLEFQRTDRPNQHRRYAVARDGDAVVGSAFTGWRIGPENRHLARVEVQVRPSQRRRGIGRRLLRAGAEQAREDGRTLLQGWTSSRAPVGDAFCEALGATRGMVSHENRLNLAEVDRAQLDRWIAAGDALTDYELVFVEPPTPQHMLPAVAAVFNVMNTAPRDDLKEEDEMITPEDVATWERAWGAGGHRQWRLFAKHRRSGELVGLTEVGWEPHDPRLVGQGDTGVLPEHRGQGLAKWLKASMLRKVLDEVPEARSVVTGNAYSNEAMLAINNELGFRPAASWSTWELPTERAL
jgi:mycothiol synthase